MTHSLRIALALALVAGTAVAGPKQQQAKKHIDKATKLHKEGKFADALVELNAAYKLDPKPDLLFAIGQVHAKMGDCTDATEYFQKFGKAKHDKQVDQVVDEAIKSCKPADDPLAHVDTTPPPPPATEPPPASMTEPPPPAHEEPPPPPPVAPAPPPSIVTEPPPAPARSLPAPHHFYQDKLGDALVVVGVGAMIGAFVEYHSATSDLDAAESSGSISAYDSKVDSAHSARTISVVLGIGGVVLAGGGVAHMMLAGHASEQPAISAAPTRGGAFVTWSGGF
jgi:tetratricopeptide (TPR) repeat protein